MKTLRNILYFVCISLLFIACEKQEDAFAEQTLFLRHKGADMPIWVRGNTASNKIVLYLHGGPGDCAMCYRHYLKGLENDVAVAYWDQRVAGASSGKVDPKTLNYAQFGEDTELVVKLLRNQYPNAQIYLLGHSFGVELTWQFLTTGNNQKLVSGAIVVNGIFSSYRWLHHMREWVLREAALQQKTDIATYTQERPVTPENTVAYDWEKLYRHMLDLGGNPVSLYSDKKFVVNYAFFSPNTALAQFTHGKAYADYSKNQVIRYERGDLLKNVRIPVALFWGKKDGVVPIEVGYETQALLTNAPTTFVTFDNAWHEPFVSETDKFVQEVLEFVK